MTEDGGRQPLTEYCSILMLNMFYRYCANKCTNTMLQARAQKRGKGGVLVNFG